MEKPVAMTVADAVLYTGLSDSYIRLLIVRRQLPHVRAGRAIWLLTEDLDSFLLSCRVGSR
jgi:excisionase family DNA binding protein